MTLLDEVVDDEEDELVGRAVENVDVDVVVVFFLLLVDAVDAEDEEEAEVSVETCSRLTTFLAIRRRWCASAPTNAIGAEVC